MAIAGSNREMSMVTHRQAQQPLLQELYELPVSQREASWPVRRRALHDGSISEAERVMQGDTATGLDDFGQDINLGCTTSNGDSQGIHY